MTEGLRKLPGSPGCVICDNNGSNPRSLGLSIMWNEGGKTVHIPCMPDETWCGYSNVVHGGIIASVLDEAMAWVVKEVSGDWAFTADCSLRFKKPIEPGRQYTAVASVVSLTNRKITAQATFVDTNGNVAVQASAIFLPAKGRATPRSGGEG